MDLTLRIREAVNIQIDLRFDLHDPPYEPGISDPKRALETLRAGVAVFTRLGIPFNLADGTVLGWLREGSFIIGDTDIDLQVDLQHYRPDLKAGLLAAGFTLLREETIEGLLQHQHFMRDGIKLDIAYYVPKARSFRILSPYLDAYLVYRHSPFQTKTIDFMGLEVPVPADPIAYVTESYGTDWRVPTTEWHWAFCVQTLRSAIGTVDALREISTEWLKWQQSYRRRVNSGASS